MPTEVPHDWIDKPEKLERLVARISSPATLAVDTEFMRRNTFYPELALLQVGTEQHAALIDPLAFQLGRPLLDAMENPANVCIMHSASEDMEAMAELLPHGPGHLFDTQIAAALAGLGAGLSYQKLVHQLTGDELDKGETRSDWLQRPLTRSQCDYAALDVLHLHTLYRQLHTRLDSLGRLDWLDEECQRVCRRAERDTLDPQPQTRLHAAADWSREKQSMLRRLLLWRECAARALDKPRPWLINDKLALDLVAQAPASLDDLRDRMRGQRAMRSAQCKALYAEIRRPLAQEEIEATVAIAPSPDREQRNTIKKLKQAVNLTAEELDIPAGLLCPRRLLEDLLISGTWPEELKGWRRPVLEPRFAPLLPHHQ